MEATVRQYKAYLANKLLEDHGLHVTTQQARPPPPDGPGGPPAWVVG